MSDAAGDAAMREVEEELRERQMKALWERYGVFVIGGAVAVVLGVAGVSWYQANEAAVKAQSTEALATALDRSAQGGTTEGMIDALAQIQSDARDSYAMLAAMHRAALLGEQGRHEEAAEAYDSVGENNAHDRLYRDLAMLLAVQQRMEIDGADHARLAARIEGLTGMNNPWSMSARETLAILTAKAGDIDEAIRLFEALADNEAAPPGMRERANGLVRYYKTGAQGTTPAPEATGAEAPAGTVENAEPDAATPNGPAEAATQ